MPLYRDDAWAADTSPSMPVPSEHDTQVDLGGFAFTLGGIAHDVTQEDIEEIFTPFFAPEGMTPTDVIGDADNDDYEDEEDDWMLADMTGLLGDVDEDT